MSDDGAPLAPGLLAWLRARRGEMVDVLAELVAIESPSTDPAACASAADALAPRLAEVGMSVRPILAPGGGRHLLARPARPRPERYQLVLGHLDTVWPLGTLAQMPVRHDRDRLHGPGVYDMKGGLVQGVFALAALGALGAPPPLAPVLLVNCDEEVGSPDSTRHVRRLASRARRCLVLEPAAEPRGALKTSRKAVGRYTVRVEGRAAHAGNEPERGASAIHALAGLVQKLFALNDPADGVTVNVGTITGGLRPNVIAPSAEAEVEVRVFTDDHVRRLDRALRALRSSDPAVTVHVDGAFGRPPYALGPGGELLWRRAEALAGELGFPLEQVAAGGASDANTAGAFTATLDGLGAVGGGAHAEHEHVLVDAMPERAALLALLLLEPGAAEPAP